MVMRIAIVCNPVFSSAKARVVLDEILLILKEKKIDHELFQSQWPIGWENFTHAWVVGGDGTLNRFINTYPDISIPITPLKGGSANDFSWLLFGDIGTAAQVERALSAKPIWVDAGDCNGNLFINGAGIGFDGAIVKDLLGKTKQSGKATYLFSVLRHIAYYNEKSCTVRSVEHTVTQECFMISVANGKRYGGGFCVAPNGDHTDGLLDVGIVGKISALKRMKYLPVIEKGAHLGLPFVKYYTTTEVEITASSVIPAHLDGELIESDRFLIKCLPKRFQFCY